MWRRVGGSVHHLALVLGQSLPDCLVVVLG